MHKTTNQDKSKQATAPRNAWIELARITAMVLILTSHFTVSFNWDWKTAMGWKKSLVNTITNFSGLGGSSLFFLITGYFLITKELRIYRFLKIEIQTLCYTLSIFISVYVLGIIKGFSFSKTMQSIGSGITTNILYSVFPIINGSYWFITTYVALLLFSPFINCVFLTMGKKMSSLLILIVSSLSIWPFLTLFSGYWNDLLFAVLSYCVGGWIRLYGGQISTKAKNQSYITGILILIIFAMFIILYILTWIGNNNNSIVNILHWNEKFWIVGGRWALFPVISAACYLLILLRLPTIHSPWLNTTICRFASGCFGVYLIHTNPLISSKLWEFLNTAFPKPSYFISELFLAPLIIILTYIAYTGISYSFDYLIVGRVQSLVLSLISRVRRNPNI